MVMISVKDKCNDEDSIIYKIKEKWWGWFPPLFILKLILKSICGTCNN